VCVQYVDDPLKIEAMTLSSGLPGMILWNRECVGNGLAVVGADDAVPMSRWAICLRTPPTLTSLYARPGRASRTKCWAGASDIGRCPVCRYAARRPQGSHLRDSRTRAVSAEHAKQSTRYRPAADRQTIARSCEGLPYETATSSNGSAINRISYESFAGAARSGSIPTSPCAPRNVSAGGILT